jgi:DnaJ-class molecular chaperone
MRSAALGVAVLLDCDVCDGSGLMTAHQPSTDGTDPERQVVWCPRCNGRGVLWGTR